MAQRPEDRLLRHATATPVALSGAPYLGRTGDVPLPLPAAIQQVGP